MPKAGDKAKVKVNVKERVVDEACDLSLSELSEIPVREIVSTSAAAVISTQLLGCLLSALAPSHSTLGPRLMSGGCLVTGCLAYANSRSETGRMSSTSSRPLAFVVVLPAGLQLTLTSSLSTSLLFCLHLLCYPFTQVCVCVVENASEIARGG